MPKYYLLPKKLAKNVPATRKPVWFLEAGVLRTLIAVVRLLPFPAAAKLLAWLFGVVGYRNNKKRKVVRRNLSFVRPELSREELEPLVKEVFYSTGLAAAELFMADKVWSQRQERIDFDVHPEALAVMQAGEPAVFFSAHIEAWQYCAFLSLEYGVDLSILYARESNPWLHSRFLQLRQNLGVRMVESTGGVKTFMRELSLGHSVGAAFDGRLDGGEGYPFFGVDTPTNDIAPRLSQRGYPLIPSRCCRLPGHRYRVEIMAPLKPRDPQASRREQTRDLALQVLACYEEWITQKPGEWLCLKRRWPKDAQPALSSEDPRLGRGKRSAPAE